MIRKILGMDKKALDRVSKIFGTTEWFIYIEVTDTGLYNVSLSDKVAMMIHFNKIFLDIAMNNDVEGAFLEKDEFVKVEVL